MFSEGQKDREAADSNEQETGNTQLCIYFIVLNYTLLFTRFYYTVCTVLNGASTFYSVLYSTLLYPTAPYHQELYNSLVKRIKTEEKFTGFIPKLCLNYKWSNCMRG